MRGFGRSALIFVPLMLYVSFTILPFYSMVAIAFQEGGETTGVFNPIPTSFTWDHVISVINDHGFGTYVRNSMIVAVGASLIVLPLSILTGYGLARFRFGGRRLFIVALLLTQFIPPALLIIPIFVIFNGLGLLNTLLGVVIIVATFELPLTVILMSGFIATIPIELEEAARVDGCTRVGAVRRVVMPLLGPGVVAVGAFAFVGAWNNFLFALFLINEQDLYVVPVGLSFFLGEYNVDFAALAAGGLVAVLPVLIIFGLAQRYITGGLSAGAVKG
jgi:multiple sugar transport system permease protein